MSLIIKNPVVSILQPEIDDLPCLKGVIIYEAECIIDGLEDGAYDDKGVKLDESVIKFDPPVEVDLTKYVYPDKEIHAGEYYINFDFGLSIKFTEEELIMNNSFLNPDGDINDDFWHKKLLNFVQFELDHSFFHTSLDPNYSYLNYALFGCLCLGGRATYSDSGETLKYVP